MPPPEAPIGSVLMSPSDRGLDTPPGDPRGTPLATPPGRPPGPGSRAGENFPAGAAPGRGGPGAPRGAPGAPRAPPRGTPREAPFWAHPGLLYYILY